MCSSQCIITPNYISLCFRKLFTYGEQKKQRNLQIAASVSEDDEDEAMTTKKKKVDWGFWCCLTGLKKKTQILKNSAHEKAKACECKEVEVRYGHVMAIVRPNQCLEREGRSGES